MSRLSPGYLNSSSFLRLQTALGSTPAGETAPAEVTKHEWRSPRYFNEDQRNRIAAVMSQVAAVMGTAFTHSFNRETTVAPTSITQHFSGRLRDLGLSEGRYYLTFAGGKDKGWGFLSVTAQAALRWVKCLLGDSGSDTDTSRALSALEESLLVDLAATALNAFLSPLRAHQDVRPGDRLLKDDPQAQFEPAQELCMIVFAVTGNESQEKDELLFQPSGPSGRQESSGRSADASGRIVPPVDGACPADAHHRHRPTGSHSAAV